MILDDYYSFLISKYIVMRFKISIKPQYLL